MLHRRTLPGDRYEFRVSGQAVSMFKVAASGLTALHAFDHRVTLTVLGFAIAFARYGLGEKLCNLAVTPAAAEGRHVATVTSALQRGRQ